MAPSPAAHLTGAPRCGRCHGWLRCTWRSDPLESIYPGYDFWIPLWRCHACGDLTDSLVLRHRDLSRAGRPPVPPRVGRHYVKAVAGGRRLLR